ARDAERVEHAVEGLLLGALDRLDEVLGRFALEALEWLHAVDREAVDIRERTHEALVVEALHELLAEALDVHRSLRGEVLERLEDLAGAVEAVGAPGPDLPLGLHRLGAASRASRRGPIWPLGPG